MKITVKACYENIPLEHLASIKEAIYLNVSHYLIIHLVMKALKDRRIPQSSLRHTVPRARIHSQHTTSSYILSVPYDQRATQQNSQYLGQCAALNMVHSLPQPQVSDVLLQLHGSSSARMGENKSYMESYEE